MDLKATCLRYGTYLNQGIKLHIQENIITVDNFKLSQIASVILLQIGPLLWHLILIHRTHDPRTQLALLRSCNQTHWPDTSFPFGTRIPSTCISISSQQAPLCDKA